ncbi:MAG: hypothetical protein Q9227_005239 [Pyrenula ochraceoflavens]
MSTTTTTLEPPATTTTLSSDPPEITASNVHTLFPDVDTALATTHRPSSNTSTSTATTDPSLSGYNPEQIRLMDEVCIVLSPTDEPIGSASKKTCHLMTNIHRGLLHRAFSVFLFSPSRSHRLLLQQRASEKITFPDLWTNTCCSHPLGVPSETGSDLPSSIAGVKRAAQRKLQQELGIPPHQVPLEDFHFLTRIHYKAGSGTDGTWGEHEIDYILFIEADVDLDINANEVRDVKYVDAQELKAMISEDESKGGKEEAKSFFTPWFRLICQTMLFGWWEKLVDKEGGGVRQIQSEEGIRRML